MSRLVIDVTGEQHKQIKALAALNGLSIKDYILGKLFVENFNNEDNDDWNELKTLMNNRIKSAEDGNISSKSMMDIAQEKASLHNKK